MKAGNEIVQELKAKIKDIEQDPIKFVATIDALDGYVAKVRMSSKYDKACESTDECMSCKKKFLKKDAEISSEIREQHVITHCSPWGDDVEVEKHKIKTSYLVCPYCKCKNFYNSEDLGPCK